MAEPFDEALPTVGQKPWSLNPAVTEIRGRLGGVEDFINGPGLEERLVETAAELNPEALSDEFIASQIAAPGSETNSALVSKIPANAGTANTVVILGDSLVAHNAIFDAGGGVFYIPGAGWFWWANALLRGGLSLLANAGVPGEKTDEIGARVGAIIALKPRIVVEEGGTNDIENTRTATSIIANRLATQEALLAAGIRVVATEVPPRNGWTTAQRATARAVNAWLADRAASIPGLTVAKWWRALVDPASSNPAAGMTWDGIHLTSLGAARAGVETAQAMRPFVTAVDRLAVSNGDQGNLLTNGAMVGAVAPSGWTLVTNINSIEAVYGQRKRPAGDGGPDWWEVDLTSGRIRHQADATTGFAVGDKVVAMVEFDTESDSRAFAVVQCTLRALNSGGSTIRQHVALADSYNSTSRVPLEGAVLDTFGLPMTIPEGTTTLRFICEVGGTGTRHRVRRAAIVKVA